MLRALLVAAGALVTPGAALCGAPGPPRGTVEKFVRSDVVVVGTVTAIEKATVEAALPHAGAKDKYTHAVAVVKLDAALVGARGVAHIRVGFVPAKLHPNARPQFSSGGARRTPIPSPELKDGQSVLLFLVKHPTADFYAMPDLNLPVDVSGDAGKKELELVKRFAATLADPTAGLTSDTAATRAETAALVLAKYRAYPELAAAVEEVAIPADESRLLLAALAGGEWSERRGGAPPDGLHGFYALRLTDKDGWKEPALPDARPGDPPTDFGALQKRAFVEWLAGPGKDYRVKKVVPKK